VNTGLNSNVREEQQTFAELAHEKPLFAFAGVFNSKESTLRLIQC
jgi:hypothetical protein